MTLSDLKTKLKEAEILEDRYYLHGLFGSTNDNEKLALVIKREMDKVVYEIYYKERGARTIKKKFATENEACQYIYEELKREKEFEDKYSR